MTQDIEISSLDLHFESYRVRHRARERRLLSSMAERGIEEPLEGVATPSGPVLLNGFKRLRCAKKLHIAAVPFKTLGTDEAMGIVGLLRTDNRKTLNMVEQARFVDDLHTRHHMDVADIARQVQRSSGWVSMRLGLLAQMPKKVEQKIFAGTFPAYAWVYTMRKFMRMNDTAKHEVERFVLGTSGHGLSVRQIEQLAHGYFLGPESFREQIRTGKVALVLRHMQQIQPDPQGCTDRERAMLKDLEIVLKYLNRLMAKAMDPRLESQTFRAQAHILSTGILACKQTFFHIMEQFNDRCAAT